MRGQQINNLAIKVSHEDFIVIQERKATIEVFKNISLEEVENLVLKHNIQVVDDLTEHTTAATILSVEPTEIENQKVFKITVSGY